MYAQAQTTGRGGCLTDAPVNALIDREASTRRQRRVELGKGPTDSESDGEQSNAGIAHGHEADNMGPGRETLRDLASS